MEFKLKEGWFNYFFSGFCAGLFVFTVGYAFTYPETISGQALYVVLLTLFPAVIIFIMACKVKKTQ